MTSQKQSKPKCFILAYPIFFLSPELFSGHTINLGELIRVVSGMGGLIFFLAMVAALVRAVRAIERRVKERDAKSAALDIKLKEIEIEERKSGQRGVDIGSISEQSGGQTHVAGRNIHIHPPTQAQPPETSEDDSDGD